MFHRLYLFYISTNLIGALQSTLIVRVCVGQQFNRTAVTVVLAPTCLVISKCSYLIMESPNGRRPCTRLKQHLLQRKTCISLIVIVLLALCGQSSCASHPTSYLFEDISFDYGSSLADHRHHLANYTNSYDDSHLLLSRTKRSVRPTKSYDFKESDGAMPGAIQFQLDKKHPSEVFKIESPNRWVTVDANGAVRVKEAWDYEQLGKEKTIDFWVFITGPNFQGKREREKSMQTRPIIE